MTQFRRQVLDTVAKPEASTNAGLWLDKYLLNDNDDSKKNLVYQVFETIKLQEAYKAFFKKWQTSLVSHGAITKEAKTLGRLAVNLGAEATLENSIALNRTYGVPYIPGSALKGLAAGYARKSVENFDAELHKDMFGKQDNAGYVTFFDALLMPNGKLGLVPDVVTVHHQEYYQSEGVPPADWDSPIPIHFLSVSGTFLIALSGPSKNLVEAAYKILAYAVRDEGIGAKTSSGYGRMEIDGVEIESESKPALEKKLSRPQEIPAGYSYGRVKEFGDTFGKIQPEGGGSEIFVHKNELHEGIPTLQPGQRVAYKKGRGKNNKEQALDVIPVE
jgi:CRISPR-associated protein Cmr6